MDWKPLQSIEMSLILNLFQIFSQFLQFFGIFEWLPVCAENDDCWVVVVLIELDLVEAVHDAVSLVNFENIFFDAEICFAGYFVDRVVYPWLLSALENRLDREKFLRSSFFRF